MNINQIGGARLVGATKQLPANLDTQKETPKSQLSIGIFVFGACFGGANVVDFVRQSVRACAPASAQIPSTIRFLKTVEIQMPSEKQYAKPKSKAASRPSTKMTAAQTATLLLKTYLADISESLFP